MKSTASLEKKIKFFSMTNTEKNLFLKGKALMQLAEINGEKSCVEQAINSYSAAIEMNKDCSYLCERAKAYTKIGQSERAVADFTEAQAINQLADNEADCLKSYHMQSMFQDLASLQDIKSTIERLRAEERLPQDFLDSYDSLVNVVTGMRVKLSEHDEKLSEHSQAISHILEELAAIKSGTQEGAEDISSLQEKIQMLDEKVQSLDGSLEKICIANKFIYDNELLNHPRLLESSVEKFSISKVLDMTSHLSSDLVSEVIEHNDSDLLLAGRISLDYFDTI